MDVVSFDTFLLLVMLVLIGIILFLSLVIAMYVIRISQELKAFFTPAQPTPTPESRLSPDNRVTTGDQVLHSVPSVHMEALSTFDIYQDAPDIPTGMKALCTRYGLLSLTVSSFDGLVIASDGNPSAVDDAARYSYAFQSGGAIDEDGVRVFELDFRGDPLLGILRSPVSVGEPDLKSLERDLLNLLQRWI